MRCSTRAGAYQPRPSWEDSRQDRCSCCGRYKPKPSYEPRLVRVVQWRSPDDPLEEETKNRTMAKQLVIVESPTKAKTLERYLGPDYSVTASKGHVRDLPEDRMGVELDDDPRAVNRVTFTEITKDAVQAAFRHPRRIDFDLVNAQQARRILDRIVGYQLSPLLSKKLRRALSAGRVQSVALRLIVDREREIN